MRDASAGTDQERHAGASDDDATTNDEIRSGFRSCRDR
jgi:hypothetical protein